MVTSASLRVAITRDGNPRCILSVSEVRRGDLILNLRGNQLGRATGTLLGSESNDPYHGVAVRNHYYSIHPSDQSKTGISLIKYTREFATGVRYVGRQYTTAFKSSNSFAPLYARRLSTMLDPTYDIRKNKGSTVSLGNMSPSYTLVFMVAVSRRTRKLMFIDNESFSVWQIGIGRFNLVVLWSYLTIAAHESGHFVHYSPPQDSPLVNGMQDAELISLFYSFRERLRLEYLETLSRDPAFDETRKFLSLSTFLKDAKEDTPQWRAWADTIRGELLAERSRFQKARKPTE